MGAQRGAALWEKTCGGRTPPKVWEKQGLRAAQGNHTGAYGCGAGLVGECRVVSDCHFRETATEYDRKTGIKWLSCTEK
jgi:hypothetical protein